MPVHVIIVIMIMIDDHGRVVIPVASMVVIRMITPIDTNRHNREGCKIGWIISVIIGWVIGHINRGVNILNDWCRLNDHG